MRHLTAHLGLTARCAALLALAVTALILAMVLETGALYGIAAAAAFAAGAAWDRQILCDDCGTSLQEES